MEIPTQIANKARLPVGTGSSHGASNHLTLRPVFTWQRIDNKYNQIGKAKEAQAFCRQSYDRNRLLTSVCNESVEKHLLSRRTCREKQAAQR